jgi:hypothetical protein
MGMGQMKQDHIFLVFRCWTVEIIVSQYCGHSSSAEIISWYIRFRELRAMEAWECHLK